MQRLTGDRGSAALVTIVAAVALFGIGAVVVDVAALYQERRVLQNGADAGALAIAGECAAGVCADSSVTAATFAAANADDTTTAVEEICGSGVPDLAACTDPPSVPAGASYVRVRTLTSTTGGSNEVPFGFAHFLGFDGASVRATAVVAWGGPSGLTSTLPITISECEYQTYADNGARLHLMPLSSPYPTPEAVLYFHDTEKTSSCQSTTSGFDLPGGFGWLETSDGCETTSDTDLWFDDKTGVPPPKSCTAALMKSMVGTVVNIPIFTETNGLTGTNGAYKLSYYAAFYLTGYSIVGQYKHPSLVTGQYPCTGQATCISGYFVHNPSAVDGTIGGASKGVTVIDLIG